jgi:hypothetical protein
LKGVEDESGTPVVHGFGGEAVGDLGDGLEDGAAVGKQGELVGFAGDDGGRRGDAVLVAEVLVVVGEAAAAIALIRVVSALVRLGRLEV